MSYQLSTENGGATMDVTKLQAAIQKQDEYLSCRRHLSDVPAGDVTLNDLTREIIRAFKECHGSAFLGKLVFSWEDQKNWSAVRSAFIPSTRVSRFRPMAAIL